MRHALIARNPILEERELIKMASLATGFAKALRQCGVTEPAASLTAEAGVAVFRISFERWVGGDDELDLLELIRESFEELRLLSGSLKPRRLAPTPGAKFPQPSPSSGQPRRS
jgi:hypothetical protein